MTDNAAVSRFLPDEEATLALGAEWAQSLAAPLVVYLQGDLGAGKTTFTRGLLRGLRHEGAVKSPTYAIVESYPFDGFTLHHFDLYRFSMPEEWEDAGLDDLFGADCVCLIEWPQQGGEFTPAADITVSLEHAGEGRRFTAAAHTDKGRKSLEAWLN
ncbi:tRNA (adenosine(37)-N6)-threonylcarbamoyltransferase complex ATPase subunit type 1 TsaE [Neisseria animalis]|uniref:tRNA threonylcarbamoyladenosine biosynthesis protein TsaE n=1 Tax=Neisseria animalis TaxID=492 RepID=A0A5P3MWD5_NEIAN|nr:tRNA (adenosine(37)-N6)-threonylcarbamoyltransferase complex ATPase subunit type 1 TsaE [Neisseria animalis]QEY25071.1 tRNA (adenosine(37)-N6)-threonylcarbamoyltransferase complex ATPase subunit type 1 TsaE [Neisseria animalis]ROW33126.1 tRNA (adenosine(37)-N6)-threonylcarbamoyltransferase complex ATPase subunit type 1 TsaE [Neisseria animalis]VEE07407.1 putative ATPase [Neisseria animalis]